MEKDSKPARSPCRARLRGCESAIHTFLFLNDSLKNCRNLDCNTAGFRCENLAAVIVSNLIGTEYLITIIRKEFVLQLYGWVEEQ